MACPLAEGGEDPGAGRRGSAGQRKVLTGRIRAAACEATQCRDPSTQAARPRRPWPARRPGVTPPVCANQEGAHVPDQRVRIKPGMVHRSLGAKGDSSCVESCPSVPVMNCADRCVDEVLSVAHPADAFVTENADGSCGFGRHGDADRREVTPVRGDL